MKKNKTELNFAKLVEQIYRFEITKISLDTLQKRMDERSTFFISAKALLTIEMVRSIIIELEELSDV